MSKRPSIVSSTENRRQVTFSSFRDIEDFVFEQFREYEKLYEERPPFPRVIYVNPDVPEDELSYHYDTDGRMVFYIHPKTYHNMLINSRDEVSFGLLDILNPISIPIVRENPYRAEALFKRIFIEEWYGQSTIAPADSKNYQVLLEATYRDFYPTHHRHADPSQRRRHPDSKPPAS